MLRAMLLLFLVCKLPFDTILLSFVGINKKQLTINKTLKASKSLLLSERTTFYFTVSV